jgi:starch synthase
VQPLKVLCLSAEVAPFAKAGGLADVCGSLPKALAALGHEVRTVMPAYAPVEAASRNGTHAVQPHPVTLQVPTGFGLVPAGAFRATLPGSDVPAYFLAEWHRFGGRPFFYGYADDPYRFAFVSRAALDLVVAALGGRPPPGRGRRG